MAQIGDIITKEETVSTPAGPQTVTKTFQVQSTPAGPKEVDITSRYADTSGISEGSDFGKFANFTFPARRDGSESNQASLLDFSKMVPLREGSTEGDAADGEEDFNPQKYRVGQINKTSDDSATATIYNYTTNVNVGVYTEGQPIPEFGNRKVKSIDPDARTVTLDDDSVIFYERRSSAETYNRNIENSLTDINASVEETAKIKQTIANTPAPAGTYWVPLREEDGGIILVSNDYARNPDGTYYRAGYAAFAEYANNNGYEIPDSSTINFIDSNANKTVSFFAAGVPDIGNREELISISDNYLSKNLSVGVSEIVTGHMKNTIVLGNGQLGIYLPSVQSEGTGNHDTEYFDYSHGLRVIKRIN